MKSWLVPGVAFLFVVLVIANPLLAHHGTSPYDSSKLTTVKGSVNTFEFINPHVEIYIDVKGDDGKIQKWVGEANSPNVLTRHGWSRDIIKHRRMNALQTGRSNSSRAEREPGFSTTF